MFLFQLFDYCLAPNTFGDGTGCDNMTCIIVTFNKSQDDPSVQNNKRCANEMESCSSDEKLGEKKAKVEPESTHEDMWSWGLLTYCSLVYVLLLF